MGVDGVWVISCAHDEAAHHGAGALPRADRNAPRADRNAELLSRNASKNSRNSDAFRPKCFVQVRTATELRRFFSEMLSSGDEAFRMKPPKCFSAVRPLRPNCAGALRLGHLVGPRALGVPPLPSIPTIVSFVLGPPGPALVRFALVCVSVPCFI